MPQRRIVLADVDHPPDTSMLAPCADGVAALATEKVRMRLLRRRARLSDRRSCDDRQAHEIDRIVASLRRLQGADLGAYRDEGAIILSEPFRARPSAVAQAAPAVTSRAVRMMFGEAAPATLSRVLAAFGDAALEAAMAAGVRVAVVPEGRGFSEFSPAVAKLVPGIDAWSSPPSGLFVVEERRVLLRSRALSMTAAHEFAHALDSVLAARARSYFSYESEEIRHYFSTATGFVNEYAASGLDEYFAESVRAYLELNDSRCAWLPVTRQGLFSRDARMFALIERLFASGLKQRDRRAAARTKGS